MNNKQRERALQTAIEMIDIVLEESTYEEVSPMKRIYLENTKRKLSDAQSWFKE